jgi:hypothetical protein
MPVPCKFGRTNHDRALTCAVAICASLCSQAGAEGRPKPGLLARATCTVIRSNVAKYAAVPLSRGRVARVLRKPRLKRHEIASRCKRRRGHHEDYPYPIIGVAFTCYLRKGARCRRRQGPAVPQGAQGIPGPRSGRCALSETRPRISRTISGFELYFRWIGNSLSETFSQRRTSTATSLVG